MGTTADPAPSAANAQEAPEADGEAVAPRGEDAKAPASSATPEGLKAFARARAYQRELYEEACKRNVVAFLDTGAGKTLIAVLLIRQKIDELNDNTGPNRRIAVFIAPTVELVLQQADVIRFHTNFKVGHYVGSMGVDNWKHDHWREDLASKDILVMTPQILLNNMQRAYFKLDKIHLLIIDECHHVKKGDPANNFMQNYYHNPLIKGQRPHIFGMTASPLDQKSQGVDKTRQFFDELERNLDAKVMTVADRSELERVVPRPSESTITFPGSISNNAIGESLVSLSLICTRLSETSKLIQEELQAFDVRRAGLHSAGVTFDKERRSTESGAMARSLQGIGHILETLGPYCATLCLKEILTPPVRRNRADDERHKSADAHPKFAAYLDSDSDDEIEDLKEDVWWVGAARTRPIRPCNNNEAGALVEAFTEASQLFSDLLLCHLPTKPQIAADLLAETSLQVLLRYQGEGMKSSLQVMADALQLEQQYAFHF